MALAVSIGLPPRRQSEFRSRFLKNLQPSSVYPWSVHHHPVVNGEGNSGHLPGLFYFIEKADFPANCPLQARPFFPNPSHRFRLPGRPPALHNHRRRLKLTGLHHACPSFFSKSLISSSFAASTIALRLRVGSLTEWHIQSKDIHSFQIASLPSRFTIIGRSQQKCFGIINPPSECCTLFQDFFQSGKIRFCIVMKTVKMFLGDILSPVQGVATDMKNEWEADPHDDLRCKAIRNPGTFLD